MESFKPSSILGKIWSFPEIEVEKETIDIEAVNRQIYDLKVKRRQREDDLDNFINQTFGSRTYFGEPEQLNIFEFSE